MLWALPGVGGALAAMASVGRPRSSLVGEGARGGDQRAR